ncbi:AEC family transporter [Clostridium sp. LBM24168]
MNYNVINEVIILSLIMGFGVFARKKNIITERGNKDLSNLLINITLPALLLTSFDYNYSLDMFMEAKRIFIYSFIINIIMVFLSRFITLNYDINSSKIIRFATIFSNSGFMGYPVLEGLFGKTGIFYGAVFNIPFNIIIFSLGVMIYTGKKDIKTMKGVILNPAVIATVVGFIMFLYSIKIPSVLNTAIGSIGSMTTPLSMIIVGSMLAEMRLKDIFSGSIVYYICFLRLIMAPILSFVILKLINADSLMLQITVVIEAMPVAVLSPILAQRYGSDEKLASKSVFITTIVSMITIPIIVILLQYLNNMF